MKERNAIVAALRECGSRSSIDEMFKRFEVVDMKEKIDCLNECMFNPETFFSSEVVPIGGQLELTMQMFLTGVWKLHTYYEKMGFGKHIVPEKIV